MHSTLMKASFAGLGLLLVAQISWANSPLHAEATAVMSDIERAALLQAGAITSDDTAQLQNQFYWQLNAGNGAVVSEVSVKTSTGKVVSSGNKSIAESNCYLFLVDSSSPMKAFQNDIQTALNSWLASLPATSVYGLYDFAEKLEEIKAVDTVMSMDEFANAVAGIKFDGKDTQLYLAVKDALSAVEQCPTLGKHLIVLSDGEAEDKAYSLNDVSALAEERGVRVHSIGFGDLAKQKTSIGQGILKRLSEETQGDYQHFKTAERLTENVKAELANHGQMGVITVDKAVISYGETALILQVDATDSAGALQSWQVPLLVNDTQEVDNLLATISDMTGAKNPRMVIAGAGFSLLLLLLLLWLLRQKKIKRQAEIRQKAVADRDRLSQQNKDMRGALDIMNDKIDAFAPQEPVNEQGEPYGWLKDVDSGQHYDLIKYSSTIGRSSENDVVLNQVAISGDHAILDFKKGKFVWTDRAPLNATLINKQPVSGSLEIVPHDVIVCGGMTLEFILA